LKRILGLLHLKHVEELTHPLTCSNFCGKELLPFRRGKAIKTLKKANFNLYKCKEFSPQSLADSLKGQISWRGLKCMRLILGKSLKPHEPSQEEIQAFTKPLWKLLRNLSLSEIMLSFGDTKLLPCSFDWLLSQSIRLNIPKIKLRVYIKDIDSSEKRREDFSKIIFRKQRKLRSLHLQFFQGDVTFNIIPKTLYKGISTNKFPQLKCVILEKETGRGKNYIIKGESPSEFLQNYGWFIYESIC
jgi:hypothetical protein